MSLTGRADRVKVIIPVLSREIDRFFQVFVAFERGLAETNTHRHLNEFHLEFRKCMICKVTQ